MSRNHLVLPLAFKVAAVFLLLSLMLPVSSFASPYAWPKATVTVSTVYDFPNITNALMNFTFYGVTHEATSSEPWITLNVSQELTADYNNTVTGTNYNTDVESFYYDDDNYYIIGNVTDGAYERVYVEFGFNLSQHLMNKSQVSIYRIDIGPVKAKCTINPDTNASFAIVNQSDMTILYSNLDLNSTSEAGTTYTITSASLINHAVNGSADPAIKVILDFMDSTGTAFNLSIDEVRCKVYYYVNVTVSDWTVQQIPSTVTVGSGVTVPFWQNLTVSTYNQGINATLQVTPSQATKLAGHKVYVNGSEQTISVSNGVVSFNITNLVANSTALYFTVGKAPSIYARAHTMLPWITDALTSIAGYQRQRSYQIKNPAAYALENVTLSVDIPKTALTTVSSSPSKTITLAEGSTIVTIDNIGAGEIVTVTLTYSTTGGIKVTAYYSDGETPLEGATVKAKMYGLLMRSGTTNSEGKVTLSGLPAGLYTVTITHDGETVYTTDVSVYWNQISSLKAVTSAELAAPALPEVGRYWFLIVIMAGSAMLLIGLYFLLASRY